MEQKPYLSVIIPSYKEGKRIETNLEQVEKYFSDKTYEYEVIVVVDGSPDDTAEIARGFIGRLKNMQVIDNPVNQGKGHSVRQGYLEAKGKYRLFFDADGSTSITHLDAFLPEMEKGFDVVIGSRDLKESYIQVHQPKHRELFGDMGNLLIRSVLGLWGIRDTQCGFKMITDEVAENVVSKMVVDRFGFDFELLILAKKSGYKIKQMPVRWLNEEGSTVNLTGKNGFTQVLIDLFKTKWRLLTGKYKLEKRA